MKYWSSIIEIKENKTKFIPNHDVEIKNYTLEFIKEFGIIENKLTLINFLHSISLKIIILSCSKYCLQYILVYCFFIKLKKLHFIFMKY